MQKHNKNTFRDNNYLHANHDEFISLSQSFEAIVEQHFNKCALQTFNTRTSYGNLNKKANRIAHRILFFTQHAHGNIMLLFEQGHDAISSIFGALKAGCAFVPVDASNPTEVSKNIFDTCAPLLLLTNNENEQAAIEIAQDIVPVINVEDLPDNAPCENPEVHQDPNAIGSIFFTSGSTGSPKGVCQSQRNLFHFVKVYCGQLSVSVDDNVSMLYSLGFAASNMDVFGALLHGATLCLYDVRKLGTARLADWIDESGITILHTVPSVFRNLVGNLESERKLPTVNGIDLGGDTVFSSDVTLFSMHFRDDCLLVNHLAATEASVIAQYRVDPEGNYQQSSVPVGYAAEGIIVEIIGPDGQEAPIGEPGEILIHSPFISPGYWNLDDLNRKAFGKSGKMIGWRTYKSGDLGFLADDARLYFLGRNDFRVKIRGHLVDTNEIEEAIHKCTAVHDAAVITSDPQKGEATQLIAYLVVEDEDLVELSKLRKSLKRYLQDYKIPSEFVFLEDMPKNSSGKIDRTKLSQLGLKEKRITSVSEKPENKIERSVAAYFSQLLKVEQVDRNSDFFLLGGNSLQAMELHMYAEKEFCFQAPVHTLFEKPTVSGIAACIENRLRLKKDSGEKRDVIVPLRQNGENPPLFLVHGMNGQAFASPYFLEILGDSQPLYAFQASGLPTSWHRSPSIEEMASHYIEAIKKIQPSGPYMIGAICIGAIIALEMAKQLHSRDEQLGPLLLIDPTLKHKTSYRRFARLRHYLDLLIHYRSIKTRWIERFRKRAEQGRILLDVEDKKAVRVATRSVINVGIALKTYRLQPYSGPSLLLVSSDRLESGSQRRKKYLTGNIQIFEVGETHNDIHIIGNERLKEHLRTCINLAISQMRS